MNSEKRKDCPMRHECGNCLVAGGFCTAVSDPICEALHNAYHSGQMSISMKIRGQPQWISVKDRLPKVRQRILVYCESKTIEKHVTCCTYMGGYLGRGQFSRHVRKVTHWMPLPDPPKGE